MTKEAIMVDKKKYYLRTVHEKKSTAKDKAKSLRKNGFNATLRETRKSRMTGRPMWAVYARKKGR